MGILSDLEPKNVFTYFEEITKIPHGSGNVDQISNYLVDFAGDRDLFVIQDKWKNVIIVKDATPGYENEPAVILQGHMDMVAVKQPTCDLDLKTQGLRVAIDGDCLYAEGTSLGGDDGIAVAYALALLDSDTLRHPRLEVIITVDEEVGMDGAREIDLSMLKGHRLLNLDSEEEGFFLTSCAGGARVNCLLPLSITRKEGIAYEISVGGLAGGHSGEEIHKERGNSNCLMSRILYSCVQQMEVGIHELEGGLADNAIPRQTRAVVVVEEKDSEMLAEIVDKEGARIQDELSAKDPGFQVQVHQVTKGSFDCAAGKEAGKIASYLIALPNGVQAMNAQMHGLVETSLNLGILSLKKGELSAEFSVRSSIDSAKSALIARLEAITHLAGGRICISGDYPGWKYRAESPLRNKMTAIYKDMFGEEPGMKAIHAGLECGLLAGKIEDLDCVSIGPDMQDIHTTEEKLSISSTRRVWEFLIKVLEEKDI